MRWRLLLLASIATAPLASAAQAATLKVDYRITLAGLTLGSADLTGAFEADSYDLKLQAKMSGLAGALSGGGQAALSAAGTLSATRASASTFAATGRSSSAQRTVRIGLSSGNVTGVDINPPLDPVDDRMPLAESHKRGVVDPLGGMIAVARSRESVADPANCDRTVPVFDGTQRFNVTLAFSETKSVRTPAYTGTVLVCSVRYTPLGGHRPSRPSVKFMSENRDMSVWLAPVEGTRVLVPLRIAVNTMLGQNVIEAERWRVEGAAGVPTR
jgi:hypothetical protein